MHLIHLTEDTFDASVDITSRKISNCSSKNENGKIKERDIHFKINFFNKNLNQKLRGLLNEIYSNRAKTKSTLQFNHLTAPSDLYIRQWLRVE